MTTTMMNPLSPATLLPAAKASGRCPPSLIRNEGIVEGGVFEMAMLRALDRTSKGECCVECPRRNWYWGERGLGDGFPWVWGWLC